MRIYNLTKECVWMCVSPSSDGRKNVGIANERATLNYYIASKFAESVNEFREHHLYYGPERLTTVGMFSDHDLLNL